MEASTIIQIVLGSSLVSALTSQAIQFWQKKNEITKIREFAALNLSHQLEDYAFECMERFSDDDLATQSKGAADEWADIPDFSLPKDDFSKFPIDLADALFALPKEIKSVKKEVEFLNGTVGDLDEARRVTTRGLIRFGIKSLKLSERVRDIYDLPARKAPYGSGTLMEALKSNEGRS